MVVSRVIQSAIIGCVVGLLSGWLGTAGAPFLVIGLLLSGVVKSQAEAAGITLLVFMFPSNILAVQEYYKRGKIDFLIGIIVTLAYLIFSGYGARLNAEVPEKTTLTANAILQFIVGILFINKALHEK